MLVENISYLATFVATAGMAVIGSLLSFQLFRENKQPFLQLLFYQQIFLFSFFIYGIWGNIALREVVADASLSQELFGKLALFVPLIGLPFLLVSWFMLVKFAWELNGFRFSKIWTFSYFSGFLFALAFFSFLFQNNYLQIPVKPDVFIIRLFLVLNFFFHLVFIFPFILKNRTNANDTLKKEIQKCAYGYFFGVVIYSAVLWFLKKFGFIGTNLSFILLFGISLLLPACVRKFVKFPNENTVQKLDFSSFCAAYEISKRESQIVLEICSGKTNKAIAEKLFITLQTVKDHNHRIYTKTGVKSRIQLANLVREKTGIK
ncbi:regulatory protein, luxR family [Mariniphaga anaerophila]|uniref:Regulatory protein, luxR family n=1 Tax=Mariniphaga anaerophila TaxID=1484053 RepID=A0A1M4T1P2_9BACT|nr:LuxR C-terminal-related transcriptional regulator [Mariniphaga anaerophila]SHE38207.1 regulatory protein, luxR family [Mariniphaga anaerophila]